MDKVTMLRIAGFFILVFACWVGWWMDYRWKRGPQGVGFYKANGQGRWEKYDPDYRN